MTKENPCKLNGFSFLEFSSIKPEHIRDIFTRMGFICIAQHGEHKLEVWQQGNIVFILNDIQDSQAGKHATVHKSGACAMGFHVKDANKAHETAIKRGAKKAPAHPIYQLPSIEGIGGSVIYFSDATFKPYQNSWKVSHNHIPSHSGLDFIDHLTHNVHRGQLKVWAKFYYDIFNFNEIRDFNIQGEQTGLYSQALASPCGKIKIPLNESKDAHSQIEEFLHDYHGEGIQHIALHTHDIYNTVKSIQSEGVHFLNTPDIYFDMIKNRLPWHEERLDDLRKLKILIDGGPKIEDGILLQIFTENVFGPAFFEIIQRKGHPGFGEGNFQALFEAIEQDQILRGKLDKR